jgi:alanyl-tRNA synthetase
MTKRLYYDDPTLVEFQATIVDRTTWNARPAVILDRTAFYATSGGQPADRGQIEGVAVTDVLTTAGGDVMHVLAGHVSGPFVSATVDWERRFDHMQQHTGQHLLSAAFERLARADTVGFHLGSEASTIDIAVEGLESELVSRAEELVNRAIWEDRPVVTRFVGQDELAALSIRRMPTVEGPIRIVSVLGPESDLDDEFDANPCGGTHVLATGQIGQLKVTGLEFRGAETRVEFLCGGRAIRDYAVKHDTLTGLARRLTVGYWEVDGAITRLEDEAKRLRRELREAASSLSVAEAREIARGAVPWGRYSLVVRVLDARTAASLRSLAQKLVQAPGVVALLAATGERSQLCFARSANVNLDMRPMLREACERLKGKGGGRPDQAQGSGQIAGAAAVQAALSEVAAQYAPHE